jgi:glucosamine-6-phosphate deaminase
MNMTIGYDESRQRERVLVEIFDSADIAIETAAFEIAALVRSRPPDSGKPPVVLGLATGSTPVRLYQRLIQMHRDEGLSFANVVTFNLDEYYGLDAHHPESYHAFMRRQLFDYIDIPARNIRIPDGTVARSAVFESCAAYEREIDAAGGIDIQILGIGRTGHIGFNEPGSDMECLTRLVSLDARTRRDAARDFLGEENVPRHAITMGVGTILKARRILLLAWGAGKSTAIRRAVEELPTDRCPASFLQVHPNAEFLIDHSAACELTRVSHPWLVAPVKWDPAMIRRSVGWLAGAVKKPILKLVESDYTENGMADLLTERGTSAYQVNIEVFNTTQHTITGWPGGKPNADDSNRPERATPHPKRVLILAPEPQDDVLCLGGTMNRLVRQSHEVRVAYLTSGNLAVPDDEILRMTGLMRELHVESGDRSSTSPPLADMRLAEELTHEIRERNEASDDSVRLRRYKGIIRRGEAHMGLRTCGVRQDRTTFLDLPFYERGRYRQFHPGEDDVARLRALLDEVQPHQIFLTGAQSDPSSVEGTCFSIFARCLAGASWLSDCHFWMYRGGGEAWPIDEIDMAVPLSPDELALKLQAVYQHRTQRSQTPVSGTHDEIWRQADEHDRNTARAYDQLGLAEYEAIETFKRWRPRQ